MSQGIMTGFPLEMTSVRDVGSQASIGAGGAMRKARGHETIWGRQKGHLERFTYKREPGILRT